MNPESAGKLRLGSNVIELLLPHRAPFVMVDFIEAFDVAPVPTLRAGRHITANEIFFAGHFPGMHMWPGSLTIEGLGQTAALLMTIDGICHTAEAEGHGAEAGLEALRNLERGFQMHPGFRPHDAAHLLSRLRSAGGGLSVSAAIDVKFVQPVFAGQRLDYRVSVARRLGDLTRFDVEACVDGSRVANGSITGARMMRPVAPLRESA